ATHWPMPGMAAPAFLARFCRNSKPGTSLPKPFASLIVSPRRRRRRAAIVARSLAPMPSRLASIGAGRAKVDPQGTVALLPVQAPEHVHAEERRLEAGQGDDAQVVGAHAAVEAQVGAEHATDHLAAGGARSHRALAFEAELARERLRDGDAARAGIDQEVDGAAVQRAGPVVVAVVAAVDLDHVAANVEARPLRFMGAPFDADEDESAENKPDRRELQ